MIKINRLLKSYRRKHALDGISLAIPKNKITGLIGRNGAGKTTLLKIIAGYWRQTEGMVEVLGEAPFDNLTVSANSIFVDDEMVFPNTLTLWEILEMSAQFYKNWNGTLAERLFHYFELDPSQLHHRLSKGQRSTFNMIVGLASRSLLTIFDEPTTGMDSSVRKDFYRALLKDYMAYPRTMIISSHHLEEIEDILEDIIIIHQGKKLLYDSIDNLREYALAVIGDAVTVNNWLQDKEVIYTESIGDNQLKAIVRNTVSEMNHTNQRLSIENVSVNDLTVYLTRSSKGGIDDVFQNS